ncbi:MAG TPA: type II toxin-antitoxin system prevent-host-death family antitoxin [Thermomicrobiales bacterium]|nr:type II toxin-antitoxin system prevent-host-death family antitoxin [Thermomicrobiales bacterium]
MKTVNIHEAKTHLSRLIEAALDGEPFIIAKAGKPLVKVEALEPPEPALPDRLGFLESEFEIPDDFDEMGNKEILEQFGLDQ